MVGSAIRPFRERGGLSGRGNVSGSGGSVEGGEGGEFVEALKEMGAVEIGAEGEPIDVARGAFVVVDDVEAVAVALIPGMLGDFRVYYIDTLSTRGI